MNELSKQLQSELITIRTGIESEKDIFIGKCREVQKHLQFNLSDNNIISKMSTAINMINEANTNYYTYLKVKLDDVDKKASSYSLKDLDYEVINQVYDLICFINEESNIKNSFEGTVNHGFSSLDLGTMAVVTYRPSLAAKEIEIKWRERLREMPASKKQVYLDKKDLEQTDKNKYKKKLAAWEAACEPIKKQREKYIESAIKQKEGEIKEKYDALFSKEKSSFETQISALQEELDLKEAEIKQLGFFKRKEKTALHLKITNLIIKIESLSASLSKLKRQYDESLLTVHKQASQLVEATATIEAEKAYPFPAEPEKPAIIKREEQAETIRLSSLIGDMIAMFIMEDKPLTFTEINRYFMGQKNNMDIRKALSLGIKDEKFEEFKVHNQSYYYLKS